MAVDSVPVLVALDTIQAMGQADPPVCMYMATFFRFFANPFATPTPFPLRLVDLGCCSIQR